MDIHNGQHICEELKEERQKAVDILNEHNTAWTTRNKVSFLRHIYVTLSLLSKMR